MVIFYDISNKSISYLLNCEMRAAVWSYIEYIYICGVIEIADFVINQPNVITFYLLNITSKKK